VTRKHTATDRSGRKARGVEVARAREECDPEEGGETLTEADWEEIDATFYREQAVLESDLRELARQIPGPATGDPKAKIWRYLIAQYGFGPETLYRLTPAMMRLYVEARCSPTGQEPPGRLPPAREKQEGDRTPASPRPPVRRNAKADTRDRWLHQQANKKNPPTWRALMLQLNKCANARGWMKLSSPQAVKQAVDRYIRRHGLASLLPRKQP
jgi:hypothetical protein